MSIASVVGLGGFCLGLYAGVRHPDEWGFYLFLYCLGMIFNWTLTAAKPGDEGRGNK